MRPTDSLKILNVALHRKSSPTPALGNKVIHSTKPKIAATMPTMLGKDAKENLHYKAAPVKNSEDFSEQSSTASIPLLMATSVFRLGRSKAKACI